MSDPAFPLPGAFALLDAGLRGGTIALLLLAISAFARAPRSPPRRYGLALCVCAILATLDGLPPIPAVSWSYLPIAIGADAAIPLFWLFAHALFEDDYRLTTRDKALAAGFVTVGLCAGSVSGAAPAVRALDLAHWAGGVAFAVHAQWLAWRSRREDLVEPRRRVRTAFILIVGVIIVWSIGSEAAGREVGEAALSRLSGAVALFAGTLSVAVLLFGLRHPSMFAAADAVRTSPGGRPPEVEPPDPWLTTALNRVMRDERAYREPELTIGALAARVGAPEHRLRRHINGTLGHRNVNAYLNDHRIEEVRAALADPAQAQVPILTIAMDAGFGSLAVFNRAFKDRLGETPTAFRRRRLLAGASGAGAES